MSNRTERAVTLPASPRRLWQAITDAGALEGWLAEEVRLELTPGGGALFRDGESVRSGWVEEVLAPGREAATGQVAARLVFWWGRDEEPASRVELTLVALASGTRLQVVETRPLEMIDLIGIPLPGAGGRTIRPALVAAGR